MIKIVSFNKESKVLAEEDREQIGSRGRRAIELAELGLPICPGFLIPNTSLANFPKDVAQVRKTLNLQITNVEQFIKKNFANSENTLLLKILESPILNVRSSLPSIHHVGLSDNTLSGFAAEVGENFAYLEYGYLIKNIIRLELATNPPSARKKKLEAFLKSISSAKTSTAVKKSFADHKSVLPNEVFTDEFFQIMYIFHLFRVAFAQSPTSEDSAVMVQAMVYGNFGKNSLSGYFFTHHIITGKNVLQGEYFVSSFDETAQVGKPIERLSKVYLEKLKSFGKSMEYHFKEIRWIRFTVERGELWIVDQATVPNKSTQAEIKTLLDLYNKGIVNRKYVITTIKPGRLSEILHPTLDMGSVSKMKSLPGGIAGAVGAAIGKVYFSAQRLVNAYREAQQKNEDTNMILAMPATFAEDVKGIEVAQGVISSEGGYASHAPVVARSMGKVAMVKPSIRFKQNSMVIDGFTVKEGDYLTMLVPYYDDPALYFGKGSLTKPTLKDSGIIEFLELVEPYLPTLNVHANADQPRDAKLARTFNAKGIGLCRTEHMFFDEKRINRFRYMILAESTEERLKALNSLQVDQTKDFYDLFKIMADLPVTIRLLDAPLHEFLPATKETMKEFVKQMLSKHKHLTKDQIEARSVLLQEFNPMLGHRGVRIAISYPEIYRMQIRAIFEAAYKLKKENINAKPEIMIPLVMTPNELKIIRNGKRIEGKYILGIRDIEREVQKKYKMKPIEYKVGTMIELPASALNADEIARYADFFSFGTNDLTQTTYGISRDDFNTFFSDYNELDILPSNPFQVLQNQVRELVETASLRGRRVRPDLKLGLCGEHGAEAKNAEFFESANLNYVSVSPYGIPIAKLAIAQMNLKKEESA